MGENNDWIWWVIAAVVLIAIVAAVLMAQRRKKQEAARVEAASLRERAHGGEGYVSGAEERARELQGKAREAEFGARRDLDDLDTVHQRLTRRRDAIDADLERVGRDDQVHLTNAQTQRIDTVFVTVGETSDLAAFGGNLRRLRERLGAQHREAAALRSGDDMGRPGVGPRQRIALQQRPQEAHEQQGGERRRGREGEAAAQQGGAGPRQNGRHGRGPPGRRAGTIGPAGPAITRAMRGPPCDCSSIDLISARLSRLTQSARCPDICPHTSDASNPRPSISCARWWPSSASR